MQMKDRVVLITGGGSGIGKALAQRARDEGAQGIIIADLQEAAVSAVADDVNALGVACDVGNEADVQQLVQAAEAEFGDIDIVFSNAGIARYGDENASNEDWQQNWDVHVMAHIYLTRALGQKMATRGEGYLVLTASAAGLLTHVDSATYAVTKHATVALAEFLSIKYGDTGVKVSVLCPQGVRTPMTAGREQDIASVDGMIEPEALVQCVVETMARGDFLIIPHTQVLDYMRRKTSDYDRWLGGMRRLRQKFSDSA